mmetsp:Transcript_148107/g.475656  ORF Transcript_148107/g.475656 Transcript_148107/m.475656 type:complete len:225 (-) Transcript_148107:287-961(-)
MLAPVPAPASAEDGAASTPASQSVAPVSWLIAHSAYAPLAATAAVASSSALPLLPAEPSTGLPLPTPLLEELPFVSTGRCGSGGGGGNRGGGGGGMATTSPEPAAMSAAHNSCGGSSSDGGGPVTGKAAPPPMPTRLPEKAEGGPVATADERNFSEKVAKAALVAGAAPDTMSPRGVCVPPTSFKDDWGGTVLTASSDGALMEPSEPPASASLVELILTPPPPA